MEDINDIEVTIERYFDASGYTVMEFTDGVFEANDSNYLVKEN